MTRLSALLLACSTDGLHAPPLGDSLDGDVCGRVPVATYTAGNECLKLQDTNGEALFRRADSDSCGGPPCVVLQVGETAYALERLKPGHEADWSVEAVACSAECCGEYLGRLQCWQ